MAQELEEMPLFPLETVLFPLATVQLHVFEDRYREMVRMCLAEDRPFGIVLIRSGSEAGGYAEPYLVGTAVRISKVHTYDDGRMDIQVKGERRFRIRRLEETHPYLVGMVEPVIEHGMEPSEENDMLIARARDEFEIYVQRLFARSEFSVQVVFPPDPVALSFTVANLLSMENIDKQRLLETTDTLERIEELRTFISRHHLEEEGMPYRLSAEDLSEYMEPN